MDMVMSNETTYVLGKGDEHISTHIIYNRCFPFSVILHVEKGSYWVCIKDKWIKVHPGEAVLIPPYVKHDIKVTEPSILNWGHMHFTFLYGIDIISMYKLPFLYVDETAAIVGSFCKNLASLKKDMEKTGSFQYSVKIQGTMLLLLYALLEKAEEDYTLRFFEMKSIYPTIHYIHTHLDQPIIIADLARLVNMSDSYFRCIFKSIWKQSPSEYVIDRKLQKACRLLAITTLSISMIAESIGYGDALYFTRLFSRKYGMPPSKYRSNYFDSMKSSC